MSIEERVRPAATFKPEVASLNMGSMNFGLYPMLAAPQGVQVRLGAALSRGLARAHLQEHLRRHRIHPLDLRRERHALRDRVLRHRPSLHAQPLRRARAGQAAVLRPVGVRHPRRHRPASRGRRPHEAHRRPPVRRSIPLVGARRRAQPDGDRGAWRRRWAAMSASGSRIRSGSARASSPGPTPSRSRRVRQIIEGLGYEPATPDEAREILAS